MATQVTHPGDAQQPPAGQTVWAATDDHSGLGLAWDWVLIDEGVVAMADPMAIVTNLRLLGEHGQPLDPFTTARHINTLVHALPWQQAVTRTLQAHRLQ